MTPVRTGAEDFTLATGTQIDLEIGDVSPLKTYQALTQSGAIARLPYDAEIEAEPHLFILACSELRDFRGDL